MTRILAVALGLAVLPACIFVEGDDDPWTPPPAHFNDPPLIQDAASQCYLDEYTFDDIIWFDAVVADPNGVMDVVQVWADVYDEASGAQVASLQLYPTDDPYYWFSDWIAVTAGIDCWYPLYSVDITAYDTHDAFHVVTVYPDTYR